jgi:hypothetical protein
MLYINNPWRLSGFLSALIIALIAISPGPANAQVLYGSMVGNITDQSHAVVPGATVTITNKETGQVLVSTTNPEGEYTINNVLPGIYDVKVTKDGFTTFTKTSLTITANNVMRTDIELRVGDVTDVVSVAADATVLQTESGTLKSEVSGKEINSLPLASYRNYQSLINLVPGATPARFQNANTDTPERALTTNVNGTPRNNNNTRIDGATSVNIWLPHHSAYVAPSESIQEVNVSTNNFDAEQGMAGGAAVQVITKSGTNQLHGSAFAYHDNHLFQARNLFQAVQLGENKPKNLRTIPGGTIGGPIIKDKLFFFGSFEALLERVIRQGTFNVPTDDQRAGNFSSYFTSAINPVTGERDGIYNPFSGTANGTGRTLFANNTIPDGMIHPVARRLLELIPRANLPGTAANYFNSAPQTMDRYNYDVKVNWNRNERHQIWAKWSHMDANVSGQFRLGAAGGNCLCDGGSGVGITSTHIGTVGHTWTLGNNFLLDGNFAITNRSQQVLGPDFGTNFGLDVLGIPGTNGPDILQSGFPQFIFADVGVSGGANNNYETLGNANNWSPTTREERSYTGTTNINKIMGRHDLRFGLDIVRHQMDHWQPEIGVGPRGAFRFTGAETVFVQEVSPGVFRPNTITQYHRFAAFLLGTPLTVEKSLQYELMTTREWQYGLYFRDRWQVGKNLTLTLGMRYELYPIMHRADRGIERLDLNTMKVLIGGRGNNPNSLGVESIMTNFAPRLGFAYRIGDDTVIRGGYGITYDPMPFARPLRGFYPLTIAQTFVADYTGANVNFSPFGTIDETGGLVPGLSVGIPDFTGPDLSSGVIDIPGTVQQRSPYEGKLHRGYIQSWNLMVERKLISDIKFEVGYVGTQTTNQLGDLEINAAEPGGRQPLVDQFGRTASTLMWDGFLSANYHALQMGVSRRLSNGLFIKGAYTYSAAINMTDDTGWAGLTMFNSPSAIGRNRARAGYDIPHNVQIATSYELPFGKGKKWVTDKAPAAILGGWRVSTSYSYYTGRPFTVTAPGGSLQAPLAGPQTPDQIKPEVTKLGGIGPGTPYYDPSAFAPVSGPARYGTVGRNTLRQPNFSNIDVSLVRTFRLTERTTMDFRIDSFNFTNTPHFTDDGAGNRVSANIAAGNNFLTITSANQDQRQFRFGLRFGF